MLILTGCQKPSEKAGPESALRLAWGNFRLREFDLAAKYFREAQAAYPTADARHLEAVYGEASCWNLRREGRNPERAQELFSKVEQMDPLGRFASWAALDQVKSTQLSAHSFKGREKNLITAYAEVVAKYPKTTAATEALLHQTDLMILIAASEEERASVEKLLTDFVQDNPRSPYLSQFYSSLQRISRHDPDQELKYALLALENTENDATNPKFNLSGSYWGIAQIAQYQVGDFDTARKFYARLMKEYPNDQRVFTAQRRIAEMDQIEREGHKNEAVHPAG